MNFLLLAFATAQITNEIRTDVLRLHNELRHSWNVKKDLVWSQDLEQFARERVQYQMGLCGLSHEGHQDKGENLAMGTGSQIDVNIARRLVGLWSVKGNNYKPGVYDHFTQMVWGETSQVGCNMGIACGNVFIACNCMCKLT